MDLKFSSGLGLGLGLGRAGLGLGLGLVVCGLDYNTGCDALSSCDEIFVQAYLDQNFTHKGKGLLRKIESFCKRKIPVPCNQLGLTRYLDYSIDYIMVSIYTEDYIKFKFYIIIVS